VKEHAEAETVAGLQATDEDARAAA
jgi:hypothetical protein